MATQASIVTQSLTARGQQRWFFGMLAEVKASAADTGGRYTLVEITAPPGLQTPLPRCTCTTARTRASTSSTGP